MKVMQEWLEADGLGGFASGTATGVRTRRYHGVLLTATTPPTGRVMLVNGVEVWAVTPEGRVALTTHHYAPDVTHPDGVSRLRAFTNDPWPTWTWDLGHGRTVVGELLVTLGAPRALLQWTLAGPGPVALEIRPLLSGRDYHALQRENGAADLSTNVDGAALRWRMYEGLPAVRCLTTGTFHADATWFRQFLYADERARGLDHLEDLASPGTITCDLGDGPAICVFSAADPEHSPIGDAADVRRLAGTWRAAERRRRAGRRGLARAVDAYLVRRGTGTTIVAGYPWFTDWGRDTFIALRGLCLATDRLGDARDILLEWAGAVDRGMLPNRFPDAGAEPEFNAVDASLWFVVAAGEVLAATSGGRRLTKAQRGRLHEAMQAILDGYARGTRYGIRMDDDGLLAAGEPGQQLTWMDARAAGREVTPRIGKPVEVQALWINALEASAALSSQCQSIAMRARAAFDARFWNDARGMLYDVVDVDHVPGTVDPTCRPNQVFAAGGLPVRLLSGEKARQVVEVVERDLWTPLGLRSLAPGEPGYAPVYEGGPDARDAAYHQGTVWPWLLDAFVDAWLATRGDTAMARREAAARFLVPLRAHLAEAGLGHVSEFVDAAAPHTPRGCPFQAWSLGAVLRMERLVEGASAADGAVA